MTIREQIAADFEREVAGRPVRWSDARTLAGDFEDQDGTLEIDVPRAQQRDLLRSLRDARKRAEAGLGRPLRVVLHTPEATTRHYGFVRTGALS